MSASAAALPTIRFGEGPRLAVAVHGITASAMSWPAVARALPADWSLLAVDLRGRGAAAELPGPYGLRRHAADVRATVRATIGAADKPVVLVGHSMGAWVALLAAEPDLVRGLVLVDGGLPMPPLLEGVTADQALDATLGPAIARLRQTYPTEQAYLDFFRAHPALTAAWNDDVAAYVRYDLAGSEGALRSRVVEAAVRKDGRDVLTCADTVAAAWVALRVPALVLRAPLGMFGQTPGLLSDEAVAALRAGRPDVAVETVPDANHYTVLLDPRHAVTVATRIADAGTWPAPDGG